MLPWRLRRADPRDRAAAFFFLHRFFTSLALGLYFSFGALLLYHKSGSVPLTLLFMLVDYLGIILVITLLIRPFVSLINRWGYRRMMITGLAVLAASYVMIFLLPVTTPRFAALLMALALLHSLGSTAYYEISNALYLEFIGKAERPASFSAFFATSGILAGIVAAVLGILLNFSGRVELLFLVACLSLAMASLLLLFLRMPDATHRISFPGYLKRLSVWQHLASAELTHELSTTALPLVMLAFFGSPSKPFLISGIVSLATIAIINVAGRLKDGGSNVALHVAAAAAIASWLSYPFVRSEAGFIILGIAAALAYRVINTMFDGRLGRQFVNAGAMLESNIAFDFAKITGRVVILCILLAAYLLSGSIGATLLVLGALFLVPKIIYAAQKPEALDGSSAG